MGIKQSKNHPLTFQFKIDEDDLSHCHILLEGLMAQSTRWLDVYFYLPRSEASILYAVKTRLPILRAFRLTYADFHDRDLPQFGDLFENAPHVRHVRIVDYPAWKLNWSSITTLHLEFTDKPQPELLVNFLQKIEHLEELYLASQCFGGSTSSRSPPRIGLPFLRCLGISTMENLLLFETPALKELYIKTISDTSVTAQHYVWVPNFVGRLNHLKKLVLLLTSINMTVLIFQYLPATQNIDFYVKDLSILKILPLCPSTRYLETITIGVVTCYNVGDLREVLEFFEFWRTQSNATTGFGRFEGLKRFTLMLNRTRTGFDVREELGRFESKFTGL